MKNVKICSLIILLSSMFSKAQMSQKWVALGAGTPKSNTTMPSMVFDRHGNLFLAYTDQANALNKITVKKFDGQTWTVLGGAQFTNNDAFFVDIALDTAGVPCIAFQEVIATTKKLTVMKFNGTSWVVLGINGFATPDVNPEIDLKIDPLGNMPFVAFREISTGKASVMVYGVSGWAYQSQNLTPGDATKISIDMSMTGELNIAFKNGNKGGKLSLMRYISGNWGYLGDTTASTGAVDYVKCWFLKSPGYSPVVAYKDLGDDKAYMKWFQGPQGWVSMGGSAVSDGQANYISVAQSEEFLFCGFLDGTASANSTVKTLRFTKSSATWTLTGRKGFTDTLGFLGAGYYTTLGVDKYDSLYVCVQSGTEYNVLKYRAFNNNVSATLHENVKSAQLSVFPNPGEGVYNVDITQGSDIAVYNALGQVVFRKNLAKGKNEIDLSQQAKGIYFLELKRNNTINRTKIVKE